ncbi:MAG: sigma 54-interacting transcriptional regulator [Archangium sp.]|nr:sigma 54-interacting transcriptional regulator [Archangium sp.]
MSGTLRDTSDRRSPHLKPVMIHVMGYEDLLAAPQGLRPIEGVLVIGRREEGRRDGGMWLDDKRVSSRHVEVEKKAAGVFITDLGSSNGTIVNGKPINGLTRLTDGDLIEVGRTLLCYRELPEGEVPANGWSWGGGRTFNAELGQLGNQLDRMAKSAEPVLLLGETGAGKEIAARRVHELSGRTGPMVSIDCGAMPETLFESTLFGHEKGAFTGATEPRVGDIARAHKGTLFLDEVGNLPLATQAKLLRVLETRSVRPVGGREPVEIDVRWVAATNASLSDEQSFRSDLRFRLAGFVARLPPLRRRREDLGLLIGALLKEAGVKKASLTRSAASRLLTHPLPGNVRQLRQVLRAAAFLATDGELTIDLDSLDEMEDLGSQAPAEDENTPLPVTPVKNLADSIPAARMSAPERSVLEAALTAAQGRVSAAARALNTSPRQLYRWLEREGLDPDAFRKLR